MLARATPNQVGLPGRSRTPQKRSSTPRSRERGLHVVVRADRHAARDDHHVGASSASASAARVPSASSGTRDPLRPPRRPPARPGRRGRRRWSCRSRRARAAAPGSVSSSPVTRTATRGLLRASELGSPDRRRDAQLGGPECACPLAERRHRGECPRRRSRTFVARRRLSGTRDRLLHRRRSLHRNHGVGALGQHRPGRNPHGRDPAHHARIRMPRPRLAHHGELRRRPRHHREPVHRRAVEGRHGERARHLLGQHPAERGVERYRFVP